MTGEIVEETEETGRKGDRKTEGGTGSDRWKLRKRLRGRLSSGLREKQEEIGRLRRGLRGS